ncbi:MAG: M20 family metallopeptidase [Aquificae bacterium]|nr:M20 family metallopeptidase [Aquificota bacterium]
MITKKEISTDKIVEKAVKELKTLISIPSHRDFLPILKYLEERLSYISFKRQEVPGKGYNLIYKGSDILINTHVDTVPPMGMKEPFEPKEIDGKIYGRGAADTKGLIASLIVTLDLFKETFPDREIPVSLAFTVDEEQNTALGSEYLLKEIEGIKYALVLEPTYGKLCNKQMGTFEFSLSITGNSFHASEFEKGENTIKKGFEIISKIENKLKRPVNILHFKGGWNFYATPKNAHILGEIKLFENEEITGVEKKIQNLLKDYPEATYQLEDAENFLVFKKGKLFKTLEKAYKEALQEKPQEGIMPSWTDAANFAKKGIECVIFGFGKLCDCHTEREHITKEELEKNVKIFYKLLSILSH